jgi:hypothetical protein
MSQQMLDGLVRTANLEWTPLVESGVDTRGIYVKCLRRDEATGRAPIFLLRFDPGAKYPYHNHPAGEELFVLAGSCIIEGATLGAGDYLYDHLDRDRPRPSWNGRAVADRHVRLSDSWAARQKTAIARPST